MFKKITNHGKKVLGFKGSKVQRFKGPLFIYKIKYRILQAPDADKYRITNPKAEKST
jgi:hypothetical protein